MKFMIIVAPQHRRRRGGDPGRRSLGLLEHPAGRGGHRHWPRLCGGISLVAGLRKTMGRASIDYILDIDYIDYLDLYRFI